MKIINKKNGFTLIELIVSITIIAVLTVAGVISYGGASKKARDNRRVADLEKIRIALELYRQQGVGNTYPTVLTSLTTSGFLQAIPTDPKGISIYTYNRLTNYTYNLGANVEDLGSTNIAAYSGCGSTCNYQVTNP
jgi:prepilin-type N-terminal cleavage/methylation domain-containing protein